MFSRHAIHVGVSAHMYGKPTRVFRKHHKYSTQQPIQIHRYIVQLGPALCVPSTQCSGSYETQGSLAFLFHPYTVVADRFQSEAPSARDTVSSKKRLYYYCFSPKLTPHSGVYQS
jgi:hypothetical protein